MLVAGLLVALHVAQRPVYEVVTPDCPDADFPVRIRVRQQSLEMCTSRPITEEDTASDIADLVWKPADACDVSHYNQCCLSGFGQCYALSNEQCFLTYSAELSGPTKWCAPPADDGISEAIVTVIVFVSLVAVAGAAGVYAAMGT